MNEKLDNYLVNKYPKIFINRYANMKTTSMCWGFQHNDGWFWLIDQLCYSIQNYIDLNNQFNDKKIPQVVASGIKEKYGILSFNKIGGNEVTDGMIRLAENMSINICEFCGTNKNVGSTTGWVYRICKECHSIEERASKLKWEQNEDINFENDQKVFRKIKIDKLNQNED